MKLLSGSIHIDASSRSSMSAAQQYMHAVLRRGLEHARREELIVRNVATLVDLPRVQRTEVEPFSQEQARRFLDVTKDDRLHAVYVLALGLGLRRGELLGLSWSDVDLDNKTLRVRQSLLRIDGGLKLCEPKTLRSREGGAVAAVVR